jgi:hypothetical protein
MVDANVFFREATLRLCGTLEIEKGLKACLDYIRDHIPAEALSLQQFEPDHAAMRVVARASEKGAKKINVPVTGLDSFIEGNNRIPCWRQSQNA